MTNETIISALRAAREIVHTERTHLADAHMSPVTNQLDADGQAGVAEYDVVLRQIDDAPASAEAQQPGLSELCQSIGAQLGSNWLVVGPDGSRFSAETPHRAANAASRHLSAMLYDPAKVAEMRAALDDLRQKAEQRDAELMEQFGSLNCPACGGSGHVDDASPQPAAQQPVSVPNPGSPEASAMIDSLLAEFNYPSNTKNAARAGYVAAMRLLAAATQAPSREPLSDEQLAWAEFGPLIDKHHMVISPPESRVHRNGGPNAGWGQSGLWGCSAWKHGIEKRPYHHSETSALDALRNVAAQIAHGITKEGAA